MDHWSTDLDSLASSQTSTAMTGDKENALPAFSSPQKSESTYTQRQRRPPNITPKRFTRFFTPRASKPKTSQQGRLDRRLRDVTFNSANGATTPSVLYADSERPRKRRRCISSDPQSSPIKIGRDDLPSSPLLESPVKELTEGSSSDEADVPFSSPPRRLRRLLHRDDSRQILLRSFGDREQILKGHHSYDLTGHSTSSVQDYVTQPRDIYDFRLTKSLGFCTTACNTNSMVAVGDEDGLVHMIDTAQGTDFSKPHITIRTHKNAVMDISLSSDDYVLATTSGDQTVRIVDVLAKQTIAVLAGHRSSIKQVHFHPDNDKMLTTSARDGIVNVWDLRCKGSATQTIRLGYIPEKKVTPGTVYPYNIMLAGPAHRTANAAELFDKKWEVDDIAYPSGVSITAIQHLSGSRSHLLLTASEVNSSLKLFDLRVAGRTTQNEKFKFEMPVSCTPTISTHVRPTGVTALALSTDGARAYSVCKDSTVWTYSTQHLLLGGASELIDTQRRTRATPPDKVREGLGPLYGFKHPKMKVASFYVKAAVRKSTTTEEEILAVGSQDACPVLFPLDERYIRRQGQLEDADSPIALHWQRQASPPVYRTGTALINGHRREVTGLAFAHGGELVSLADDFTARCWRQDGKLATHLRNTRENRWRHGWADVEQDESDDLE